MGCGSLGKMGSSMEERYRVERVILQLASAECTKVNTIHRSLSKLPRVECPLYLYLKKDRDYNQGRSDISLPLGRTLRKGCREEGSNVAG